MNGCFNDLSAANFETTSWIENWKTTESAWVWMFKGLAAQSKAEAIGWNKISSANQRPGFQMIFYTCQSARHMIMQLWFAV